MNEYSAFLTPKNITFIVISLSIIFYFFIKQLNKKEMIIDLKKIDRMKGLEFEHFVAEILKFYGYLSVEVTKGSGDFGIDVMCYNKNKKMVCQVKRYKEKVGVTAIQEAVAGKVYYKAHSAAVITNSYFTAPAIKMAEKCNVILIDRENFLSKKFKL